MYSVYGTSVTSPTFPGLFVAGCETKLETTGKAITAIRGEIERMRTEMVPSDE